MTWLRTVTALFLMAAYGCDDGGPVFDAPTVAFDVAGEGFWDSPFPSDLRLTAEGRPDLAAFPNPNGISLVSQFVEVAKERRGFPVMPTVWFRFTQRAPQHDANIVLGDELAVLVDIDDASPERGTTFPVVAQTLADDDFTLRPEIGVDHGALIAVATRPGTVLRGNTRYAVVLRSAFAPGVSAPAAFTALPSSTGPAADVYAPLWPMLDELGIDDALVATVFTTGDEVQLLADRSDAIIARDDASISNLHVETTTAGYCVLAGDVTVPMYQAGTAPYENDGGRFVLDADGLPMAQGTSTIPLRITLPLGEMPASGWPLWQYFHGSGGASFDIVDEGPTRVAGQPPVAGMGPGTVAVAYGIATAATALPVNPERIPGADAQAYLQLQNLGALPYTFQQGVFEQRMLLDALLALRITDVCAGVTLPANAPVHRFDPATLTAGGHSMGGMYANMIGAVEPRYGALTPFGAGGFWPVMILDTEAVPDADVILAGFLGVDAERFTFVHPVLGMLGLGWEIAEPGASMARLQRRPIGGGRHVYQPIGLDDRYFPNAVFDAAALAYGNEQAGDEIWIGTQEALATDRLEGVIAYPVSANRGTTGVVVQYADDGIVDSHQIYRQLDAVKAQYGCFLASYIATGVPTVIAPNGVCPFTQLRKP
jgi:hypothetical protein